MKENLMEMVFILDRSGSMTGLESDTIGGFNGLLKKQQQAGGEALVTTILFDDAVETLHDRLPVREVPLLTADDYYTRGSTALLDAVGMTLGRISQAQRQMAEAQRPAQTIVVIITDGLENASREYRFGQVQQLVRRLQDEYGWEFRFLGANMDAVAEAAKIGIDADDAAEYACDGGGVAMAYDCAGMAIADLRQAPDRRRKNGRRRWKEEIGDYMKQRQNGQPKN